MNIKHIFSPSKRLSKPATQFSHTPATRYDFDTFKDITDEALGQAFPGISQHTITQLAQTAAKLDKLPSTKGWLLQLSKRPDSDAVTMVLLITAILHSGKGGELELELDFSPSRRPVGSASSSRGWTVTVDVGIDCLCEDNHNTHYLERHEWEVYSIETLPTAFEAATSTFLTMAKDSHDPAVRRRRAGLPQS